ncbi:hypothetical protein [Rhizorhabdus histidinilytica]|uniref:hypothetical protein n=1 Tax=Rhizorhabdus histidinilytica TaxID=439228 RepID=UPI00321F8EB3
MKIVSLAVPAILEGALRYPVENPLTVSDTEATRLKDAGVLDGEPEDLPEEGGDDDDGLDSLKVAELDAIIAEDASIQVEANANKAAKVAAIRAARDGQ